MTDNFDELDQRLAGLASDLNTVRLPGPTAARRRAAQRTRHHVTTAVLGAAATIAIGAAVVVNQDAFTTTLEPAPPVDTSEPSPAEPTAAENELHDALMRAEDIAELAIAGDWIATAERGGPVECVPTDTLDSISALQGHERVDFAGQGDTRLSQDLVRVASDDAAGLLTGLRDEVLSCLPPLASGELPQLVDDLDLLDVGDEGWLARYYLDPDDPGATTVVVGLVRFGDVLSVTVATHPTSADPPTVDSETPTAAAERMCDVLFSINCVGEPRLVDRTGTVPDPEETPPGAAETDEPDQPVESPPSQEPELLALADNPYLGSDDVNPVGSYSGFADVQDSPIEPVEVEFVCLDRFFLSDAEVLRTGSANSQDNEATITELIQQMPTAESAMTIVTDHTILPDQCGEVDETRVQTVHQPAVIDVEGADEALVWSVNTDPLPEDPGSEPSFHGVGLARSSNVVVVIVFGAFGDPTEGGWADYAASTLALALDRAIE